MQRRYFQRRAVESKSGPVSSHKRLRLLTAGASPSQAGGFLRGPFPLGDPDWAIAAGR